MVAIKQASYFRKFEFVYLLAPKTNINESASFGRRDSIDGPVLEIDTAGINLVAPKPTKARSLG